MKTKQAGSMRYEVFAVMTFSLGKNNMNPRISTIIGVLLILLIAPAALFSQNAGQTGLAFLKVGVGARSAALAESYVALAEDPYAIYWNPAGLALSQGARLAFTHLSWLESIRHDFAAVSFPGFGGTLGLGMTVQSIPGIELRDQASTEPLGTFDAHDFAATLAYARNVTPDLSVGVSAKYLYEKLYVNSASGFALDIGANLRPAFLDHLRLAVSIQNIGTMQKLVQEKIKLPALLRLGGAYTFSTGERTTVVLVAENLTLFEGDSRQGAGIELNAFNAISVRGGYHFAAENRGPSAGFGASQGRFAFDYGFAPFSNDFDSTHRFSVAMRL